MVADRSNSVPPVKQDFKFPIPRNVSVNPFEPATKEPSNFKEDVSNASSGIKHKRQAAMAATRKMKEANEADRKLEESERND